MCVFVYVFVCVCVCVVYVRVCMNQGQKQSGGSGGQGGDKSDDKVRHELGVLYKYMADNTCMFKELQQILTISHNASKE